MAQIKSYCLGILFLVFLNFLISIEARTFQHVIIKRQFPQIPETNRKLQTAQKYSLNRYYSTFANAINPSEISSSNPAFCINPPLTPLSPSPLTDNPPLTLTPPTPLMANPLTPDPPSPITNNPSLSPPSPLINNPPLTPNPPSPTTNNPSLTPPIIQPIINPTPPKIANSPPKTTPIMTTPPTFTPGLPIFLPPIIYPPPLAPPSKPNQNLWCVAKPAVPDPIIQEAMDYACGSGADCGPIRPNGPCFEPDSVISHAAFAFNSYWQDLKETGATCDFGGVAVLVTKDPSYDSCHFKLV